jgi:fucose 4-O-acetylase-like acetyltransferase
MAQRNYTISICKGIAIILMVIGHAEAPELLTNFIYTFHMPLFFITAGYFFTLRHAEEPWRFCSSRFKRLYLPFLKWSIIFLLLHNVWHHFGILNEQFGNWTGGVTHPYTLKLFWTRLLAVVYSMSGYDEFMTGAFWFFRGLLVASILFMVLFRLLHRYERKPQEMWLTSLIIMALALGFMAFHLFTGVKMQFYPNGFWRETWGVFFFGLGVVYRKVESKIPSRFWLFVLCLGLLICAGKMHLSGMNNGCKSLDLLTLPLTASIGFLMVKYLSEGINSLSGKVGSRLRQMLIYVGENTFYVFVFHIISFKLVSLLKIQYYGLDFRQIGCHMVIHFKNHDDLFWVLYSIVGVAVPLLVLWLYRSKVAPHLPTIKLLKPKQSQQG